MSVSAADNAGVAWQRSERLTGWLATALALESVQQSPLLAAFAAPPRAGSHPPRGTLLTQLRCGEASTEAPSLLRMAAYSRICRCPCCLSCGMVLQQKPALPFSPLVLLTKWCGAGRWSSAALSVRWRSSSPRTRSGS